MKFAPTYFRLINKSITIFLINFFYFILIPSNDVCFENIKILTDIAASLQKRRERMQRQRELMKEQQELTSIVSKKSPKTIEENGVIDGNIFVFRNLGLH